MQMRSTEFYVRSEEKQGIFDFFHDLDDNTFQAEVFKLASRSEASH